MNKTCDGYAGETENKMEFKTIASKIAKREGKKVPVSIGNVREVLKVLIDIEQEWIAENIYGSTGHNLTGSPLGSLIKAAAKKHIKVRETKIRSLAKSAAPKTSKSKK